MTDRYDPEARNVLGGELMPCSNRAADRILPQRLLRDPAEDVGMHTVCAVMTAEFLAFSAQRRQRPRDAAPGVQLSGAEARRPLVPLRAALEGGARRRRRPARGAGSHPRGDPGDHPLGVLKDYAVDV